MQERDRETKIEKRKTLYYATTLGSEGKEKEGKGKEKEASKENVRNEKMGKKETAQGRKEEEE